LTTAAGPPARPALGVAYVLLELLVVPLVVLLLALTSVSKEDDSVAANPPHANVNANVNANALPLPSVSPPGAALMMDPGRRTAR
jgi:hypothetical protein